jgi:sugar lactone lactonase YvrE
VDAAGNVYVTDFVSLGGGSTIRKITPGGVVTTIETGLIEPIGIAADSAGNLFFSDENLRVVYELSPVGANWNLSYVTSEIYQPAGVAVDGAGNVYVADLGTSSIKEISSVGGNWVVSTIAGGASAGSADGAGTNAQFEFPSGVAVDTAGNVYVSDYGTETIRKITPAGTNWVVSTIGGLTGQGGGTDGLGSAARFYNPAGVAVDTTGIVYVADSYNNSIRKGVFSQFTPAVQIPFTPPSATGQLVVTLLPPEANGQWRFPWELAWRNSGATASNLVAGVYPVVSIPPSNSVNVTAETTLLTNYYYASVGTFDTNIDSSLTVNIQPSLLAGAGWKLVGDTNSFYPPSYTTNLLGGTYLVEFAPVAGFATPGSFSVQVTPGAPTAVSATYSLAQSPPAGVNLPAPVPSANIADLANYPYGFNGQLQTDVGYGSGVAVQTNIVLTAAHLVFGDQTLSYVNNAWWFYQEEAGVFTPEPLPARGWYVLSGYASQRTNDQLGGLGPDQSSPQSRNFDVAALYFESPVANGGYGGWLPSDNTPNPWLTGTAEKLLVGYPVDGSGFGNPNIANGAMYEIGPQPYPLSVAPDPVNDQQVYTASWFLSYPGNSGGPLYVQLNGYFYPAGVYLGTLFNGIVPYASAVRAIDSNVVSLITMAAALGDSGTNFSGVITIIPSRNTSRSNPGYLILQLGPPAAVQAGAAWKLTNQSDAFYSTANPSVQEVTSTNTLVLQFKAVAGYNLPTNRSVTVTPGLIVTNLALYTVTNPLLRADAINGLILSGTPNTTYQIQSNNSLVNGTWRPFITNTVNSAGTIIITNRAAPGFYRALWLTNSP